MLEVTRPKVIKWYCPFADQRKFPSGHRYSINVYTGCQHKCGYCYVTGYSARQPDCKNRFRQDLCKNLEMLEAFDVPPAPVHLSNSASMARRMGAGSIGRAATIRVRSAARAVASAMHRNL
ncbi:MAG TPA: hypothetical protein VJL29_02185 [Thermoguttaceae bacterium]|nr:hypothetical protein [Thermoguttaceae bacterium]